MFWNPSKLGALDRDLLEYFCCVASLSLATFGCNNAALGCALVRVALQGQTITAAPVLQALMAFASLHRYGLQSQALELKVAALGSLAQEPRAPSLGVEATLQHAATGMLLCSFEMHQSSSTSGHWPFYLGGVKAVFGACSTKTLHQLGSDVAVLLDWVHYHDVLARFSLLHWTKGGSSDLPPAPTDFFCPQVSKLPPPIFCMLNLLSQVCDAVSSSAIPLNTSGGVGDYKSFLEVLDWRIRSLSIPQVPDDDSRASDDTTLVMQLYQLAILLFLDRCFEDLIDQPVRTQQNIDKAFAILPQLSFCKQQFPIHVIGCEARTDEQRAAVLDVISRTEKMSSSRSLNYCKRILQAVWAQDDLVNGCNIGYREKLSSIGAGIQLSPNATRLLQRWGVFEEVLQYAAQPEAGTFRSYRGDMLSQSLPVSHPTLVREEAPYIVIHRADLLRALLSGMERHGITLKLSSEVKEINFHKPSIRLSNDEVYEADLILGADGERSRCRGILLGREDPPHSPGDVVYRISVPTKNIAEGHAAWDLKRRCSVNFWMGPGGHVVSYLIQHDILNLVLVYTEGAGGKVMYGPQRADLDEFRSKIVNWDPVLHELINVPGSVCTKWTLFQIHEVIQWRHESGRFVLIGDAAHAILPCLAQGAAQAFEDAGVLGAIFSQPVGRDQIPDALRVFEEVRKPRASDVRHCTLEQKAMFALSDGPGQEERDAGLRAGADHGLFRWLWEYDAAESGREAWEAFLNKAREDGIEPRHDN
ncbi:hypothetical protein VD0002_g7199 [Verticillium dahliae]|uniref:FAD-binding domain-containing protein n=1 Tax=Verticillium dahliae TaxID=27337 RepID=A0AA44WNR1_VERDA|nr:14-3-3 protein-like protein [Verticillium dahliae VDG2]PNH34907.1 hypothetical protein BJF96_g1736 [Verticillium dahliae]PNH60429.1 hypothetical protein VD0002_g7199 [Verticillium dahliae]